MPRTKTPRTISESVSAVLRRARRPLPLHEIIRRVGDEQAPASVGAVLSAEANKPGGAFVRTAHGVYGLRK